ncbi:copia protein [Tanacetum coccineum]
MDGGVYHSKIPIQKVYMANSIKEEEYFNPLEIEDDVFSYESLVCLLFEQCTQSCDNESIDTFDLVDNIQELKVKHKDMAQGPSLEIIISRWHVCKPIRVFYDNECVKDCGMWPTCNPDLSICSGYDAIYGNGENGMLEQRTRFDEYTEVFDKIEQLGNEYDLRIGKKGYALDDVWDKCKKFHGGSHSKEMEFEVTSTRIHVVKMFLLGRNYFSYAITDIAMIELIQGNGRSNEVYSTQISIHSILDKTTYHLIDKEIHSKMKMEAILINCSRGPMVDEEALVEHLKQYPMFRVRLDVLKVEPYMKDMLTTPPVVNLDPSMLKPRHLCGTTSCIGFSSLVTILILFS